MRVQIATSNTEVFHCNGGAVCQVCIRRTRYYLTSLQNTRNWTIESNGKCLLSFRQGAALLANYRNSNGKNPPNKPDGKTLLCHLWRQKNVSKCFSPSGCHQYKGNTHISLSFFSIVLLMFYKTQLQCHVVLFTRVWDSHSGMDALCRLFPIRRDWKAELKKPSPGPLVRENNHDLSSRSIPWDYLGVITPSHKQTHLLFNTTKWTANIVT